ncbi:hypothetical protein TWF718_009535 [Orbilia javanica]|uniref:Uncharacterized protein n=1 Tax=Orbilia javanica TaxID=47235 RepID=A0AAN8RFE8_9PEZI
MGNIGHTVGSRIVPWRAQVQKQVNKETNKANVPGGVGRMGTIRDTRGAETTQREASPGEIRVGMSQLANVRAREEPIKMEKTAPRTKKPEEARNEVKATQEIKKEAVKPEEEAQRAAQQEVKRTSRQRVTEVRIQTMRAQEAADPDLLRFGYKGWAGEFFNKFCRPSK